MRWLYRTPCSNLRWHARRCFAEEVVGGTQVTNFIARLSTQSSQSLREEEEPKDSQSEIQEDTRTPAKPQQETKLVKVALFGQPNVGKSTLINQIVGRMVCPVSMKAHTTRLKVKTFVNDGDTQIVFLDTPGLVRPEDIKKFKFQAEFLKGAEEAIYEADILGYMYDATFTKFPFIPTSALRLLLLYQQKENFLLLNKVDAVKKKHALLSLVTRLTQNPKVPLVKSTASEQEVSKCAHQTSSWPHFKKVFMVSALEGDGVGDVKEYLLSKAKPGPWLIKKNLIDPGTHAMNLVKAACLDYLNAEIPYLIDCKLNYCEYTDGVHAIEVMIIPHHKRHAKLILNKIRNISTYAESNLASALEEEVRLRVGVDVFDE